MAKVFYESQKIRVWLWNKHQCFDGLLVFKERDEMVFEESSWEVRSSLEGGSTQHPLSVSWTKSFLSFSVTAAGKGSRKADAFSTITLWSQRIYTSVNEFGCCCNKQCHSEHPRVSPCVFSSVSREQYQLQPIRELWTKFSKSLSKIFKGEDKYKKYETVSHS